MTILMKTYPNLLELTKVFLRIREEYQKKLIERKNKQKQKIEQQVIWTPENIGILELFARPLMESLEKLM